MAPLEHEPLAAQTSPGGAAASREKSAVLHDGLASRDVALAQPHFDRYWGGTLDVEVPVTRGPEGGFDARFR